MMSLLTAMLMTSPLYKSCAGLPELEWRLCQPRVIYIGTWDPVPWDYAPDKAYIDPPKAYGAFPLEKDQCPEP